MTNIKILLLSCPDEVVSLIRSLDPLPGFTHQVLEKAPDDSLAKADLIITGPELDDGRLEALCRKNHDSQIVFLQEPGRKLPAEIMDRLFDLWPWPADREQTVFHFSRWQRNFQQKQELWQNSHLLDTLLETSPNLIWVKTRDGIHTLVNSSFSRTVGKPRADILGKTHAYIWDVPDDDPACIESEQIVMESGRTHVADEEISTGEGLRQLTTYKSPLRNPDGTMMGTLGIGVDITQERHYHKQMLQNNATLESIFTSMDCGIICHTLSGDTLVSVNREALRLLDYASIEDMASGGFDQVADTVLDEDKPGLRAAISSLKNVGDSASYEYRVRHNDGTLYHVMGNAKIIEKDGQLLCQRFLLDCTAQKQAEEKAQSEKERRQMELVRALSIDYQLVFFVDANTHKGTVLQLKPDPDPMLESIFAGDQDLESGLAAYADQCVHPDDREAFIFSSSIDRLGEVLQEKGQYYFNYRVRNGDDVMYYQMKAVLAGDQEEAYGMVVGLQSVDSRTRYEMQQKSKLAQALKEAKKASRAKSIFLSNMSHDIRTPMNAVVGYTSLALSSLDKRDNVRSYLEKILTSGRHLINLINDILDMSHIESGKIQLEEKECEFQDLLTGLWNMVQPTAQAKNQTLTFNTPNVRHPVIFCDRLRVNQVLLNLLGNSIKYTPEGGTITMEIRELPCAGANQAAYEFRISDNGIGMTEEFLSRIFEPFERAQTSTIAGIQGTGLGMAITKNLVEMMQGDIEVSSILGQGTEFVFRVAFMVPEVEPGLCGQPQQCSNSENVQPESLRSGFILLSEDNAMNQEIACEFLKQAGYEVDVACNGREAVDMLKAAGPGHYDLVLMDVQMPVLDGYGATEIIRSLPDPLLSRIPIIAMTANSFEEDRQEALRRGMNFHIAKPIDFAVLFATLDKILCDKKGSPQALASGAEN